MVKACEPLLTMLEVGEAPVDENTRELLCASLPFALRVAPGATERHSYQEKILDVVAAQFAAIGEGRQAKLDGLEKEKADLEAEVAQATEILEGIQKRLAEKQHVVDDAEVARKAKDTELAEAQAALEAANSKAKAGDDERLALERDRDDFVTGLAELFAPLKNSELAGTQWRARDKLMARLLEKLKVIGVAEALMQGLPVALKMKVDTRSDFAKLTVTHGEELYTKHMQALTENVDNFGQTIMNYAKAVAAAEASAKAAQEALNAATETSIDAQNAWVAETTVDAVHRTKMAGHAPAAKAVTEQIEAATSKLAHFGGVVGGFEALRPVAAALKVIAGDEDAPAEASAGVPMEAAAEAAPAEATA